MSDATRRALRTFLQALIALIPTIPGAAAVFNISAEVCAKVGAVGAVLVTVITFVVNYLEDNTNMPALLKAQPSAGRNPVTIDPVTESGHIRNELLVWLLATIVIAAATVIVIVAVWDIPHS